MDGWREAALLAWSWNDASACEQPLCASLPGRCLITLTENETSFLLEILPGKAEE